MTLAQLIPKFIILINLKPINVLRGLDIWYGKNMILKERKSQFEDSCLPSKWDRRIIVNLVIMENLGDRD